MSPQLTWKPGYCAPVSHPGDCQQDASGFWRELHRAQPKEDCVRRCLECRGCRFVSFSHLRQLCSWHTACDLEDLRRSYGGVDFQTAAVTSTATAALSAFLAQPVTVMVTTLALYKNPARHCGLVGWCEHADRLRQALVAYAPSWTVEIGVIGRVIDSRDCPLARAWPLAPTIERAVNRCWSRARAEGWDDEGTYGRIRNIGSANHLGNNIFKWMVFNISADFVLFSDTDITLVPTHLPTARAAARWVRAAFSLANYTALTGLTKLGTRAPLPEGTLALVTHDGEAPVQGGLIFARPSATLYESGLFDIERCVFTRTGGWMGVGRPSSQKLRPQFVSMLRQTQAFRRDDWGFLNAEFDQGSLWYQLFLKRHRADYLPNHRTGGYYGHMQGDDWFDTHYWGKPKAYDYCRGCPFESAAALSKSLASMSSSHDKSDAAARVSRVVLGNIRKAYVYLCPLQLRGGGSSRAGFCTRRLWMLRRAIETDWRFDRLEMNRSSHQGGRGARDAEALACPRA